MEEQLRALAASAKAEIAASTDRAALDKVRVKYLGKQSELTKVMSQVGKLPPEQRKAAGAVMNEVKAELEAVVRHIHVDNAQPVEFGQVLFELEPLAGRPLDAV